MKLIKEIRADLGDCLASRCGDSGCRVRLDKIHSQHVIVSGTKYQGNREYRDKLCDFMVFNCDGSSTYRLAVIDTKGGIFDIDGLHRQLQNGADVAGRLSGSYRIEAFVAVAVKKQRIHVMARKAMLGNRKYWVRLREFFEVIRILKHDRSLKFS